MTRQAIAFDYDGTIHAHPGWHPGSCGQVDTSGIDMAHDQGFSAVVQTCGELPQIAADLRIRGYTVQIATARAPWHIHYWQGGSDGTEILLTPWKARAVLYPDDRGARHAYGDSWAATLAAIRHTGMPQPQRH